MSCYQVMILEDTGCTANDAGLTEHIMREGVLHSTLDWETRTELRRAACRAAQLPAQSRELYELERAQTRAAFEEVRRASGP